MFDREVESQGLSIDQVVGWVHDQPSQLVVITGGEPLVQRSLAELCTALTAMGRRVEIETSGIIAPSDALTAAVVARFVVSPKLAHSGMSRSRCIRSDALRAFGETGKATFKFVARVAGDLDEVAELENAFGLAPIWIMPEGTSEDQVLAVMRRLADPVLARGWHLTSRLHILIWGDRRGR